MPTSSPSPASDSLHLLPTVLQHLPTLLSNPPLALSVFLAIRKSTSTQSQLLTPLLAPLTSVTLSSLSPQIRHSAIATTLSLVRALISNHANPLPKFYVLDLVTLAHRLIAHSLPTKLSDPLPRFLDAATKRAESDLEKSTFSSLNVPPIPVSPPALQALLYLLAAMIPADHPPNWPTPCLPDDFPSTCDMTALRLWTSVGPQARASVLNLVTRHALLSGRLGEEVADAALCILERSCDSKKCGCVVSSTTRVRLGGVLEALLVGGEWKGGEGGRERLFKLCRVVGDGLLSGRVWAVVGVGEAVRGEGGVGRCLREMSKEGGVDNSWGVKGVGSEGWGEMRRKRRRVGEGGDIQEVLSQSFGEDDGGEGVVGALMRELARLETIFVCVERAEGMRVLVRVVVITGEALGGDLGKAVDGWLKFAHSLVEIVGDVCGSLKLEGKRELWDGVLELGLGCVKLVRAMEEMGKWVAQGRTTKKRMGGWCTKEDCSTLGRAVATVLTFAGLAFASSMEKLCLRKVGELFEELGETVRVNGFLTEKRKQVLEEAARFRKFALDASAGMEEAVRCILLKGAIRTEIGLIQENNSQHFKETFSALCNLLERSKLDSPALGAAALQAVSDVLCSKLGCRGNHAQVSDRVDALQEYSNHLDTQSWSLVFREVEPIVRGAGTDDLISSATRCLGTLLIHAPRSRAGEASSSLIKALWHPTCELAREIVISVISSIMVMHGDRGTTASDAVSSSHPSPFVGLERGDSWDGFETVVTRNGEVEGVVRLLAVELESRLQKWKGALASDNVDELEVLDPSPLLMILRLDDNDSVTSKITGLTTYILLASSLVELKAWRMSLRRNARAQSQQDHDREGRRSMVRFKVWSCFVSYILNNSVDHNVHLAAGTMKKIKKSGKELQLSRDLVRGHPSSATVVANFLSSRMNDWLPYALKRMLSSDYFAQQICDVLMFPDQETLWKKVPKHTVGALLRNRDISTLESLSLRVKTSKKELVELVCADALARAALLQPEGLDLSPDGSNALLYRCLELPLEQVVVKRAGKIVQRIVMEIGGYRDATAKKALTSLSRVILLGSRSSSNDEHAAGTLVSNHFMLVLDAVGRGLLHSKTTKKERIRFIRRLDGVLNLARAHLHLFVPKILATLKAAINADQANESFQALVLQVWRNFLITLGPKRCLPHLTSVLADILPFLHEYADILCPALKGILEECSFLQCENRSEIVLLLRIVNHPALRDTLRIMDSWTSEEDACAMRETGMRQSRSDTDMKDLVQTCENVSKIISQHANGVIEVMAAEHLFRLLRSRRQFLDKVLETYSGRTLVDDNAPISAVACLLGRLVSTLNKSKTVECQERLLRCIGEIGALDPAVVQKFNHEVTPDEMRVVENNLSYNCEVQSLISILLNKFLVVALKRGEQREGSSNHLNRVGLVIQELLRVCGCRRDTASRARNIVRSRTPADPPVDWKSILVGGTGEENGILFWENLDAATQTIAQPYLAEPFDVQHYKAIFGGTSAGDIELACQPVWSKVKAATPTGMTASAQEWRRQLVVQLVDYIGIQGKFGKTFKALRPILRYDDNIASYIFPFAVTATLDLQRRNKSTEIEQFLVREIALVLTQGASSQPVSDLFDTLRKWREERSRARAALLSASDVRQQVSSSSKRRGMAALIVRKERQTDTLTPLIDMEGHESPPLSLLVQAKAAFAGRSYASAVMLAECFIRNQRISQDCKTWPASIRNLRVKEANTDSFAFKRELEAYNVLQRAFADLEDPDSMAGVASLRANSSLVETVLDAEAAGRHDEALTNYERAIAQNPRSAEMHEGFLHCLMTLGHWETMLSHAEGVFSSTKLEEVKLRECSQALGIDAAWRLGRWEKVEEFSQTPRQDVQRRGPESKTSWTLDFNINLGNMFAFVRNGEIESLKFSASTVRKQLLTTTCRLAREGYGRAYPTIVLLQILSDVEDAVYMTENRKESDAQGTDHSVCDQLVSLVSLRGREQATAPSLRVKEPILSTRRVCYEQAGKHNLAAGVNLRLAELAHDADNLRAASAYAFQASTAPSVQDNILNEAVIRLAHIARAQGDESGALLTVKGEIERLLTVGEVSVKNAGSKSNPICDRLCTAYLLAGRWIEEARSEPSDVILDYYQEASVRGAKRVEPFYALGRHFDMLLQAGVNADSDVALATTERGVRKSTNCSTGGNGFLQFGHHVPQIIKNFAKALCNGHSRLFEALPRMLTVWFDYHSALNCPDARLSGAEMEDSVNREMRKAFKIVPLYMWMTAIPQLMSRLLHPRKQVQDEVMHLLARVYTCFPEQCSWLILPSCLLHSQSRKKVALDIVKMVNNPSKRNRKRMGNENESGQQAKALRTKVGHAHDIVRYFVEICSYMLPKEKRGRVENCSSEFSRLRNALQKNLSINPIVPTLKTLTVQLPSGNGGVYKAFARETSIICAIEDDVLVMSSMMRPRRICLIGSDGKRYRFLAKKETAGDMRKDSRLVEFMTVVNRLLGKDSCSCRRNLELKTYAVLPLTEEAGMIEWVNDLEALRTLVRVEHMGYAGIPDSHTLLRKYDAAGVDKKGFLEWTFEKCPAVLDKFFLKKFGGGTAPEAWLKARNLWTRSVAVWSMAGYIVGLGDRHGENILIETTTGQCVHVDFAMLFEKGQTLKVPEVVPFRLTPNMVTAMGIAGYEGVFRIVCEVVLGIMRRNSDALLGVLETFLYDPLADWSKGETRSANGFIVANKEAWQCRAAVKAKLTGMVDSSGLPLSIKGQVERLIHEASGLDNLSKMYIWWSPWI